MAKYTVQYEVVGAVDIEVEADSVNDALLSPTPPVFTYDVASGDDWDWTSRYVYTEEGERVYG